MVATQGMAVPAELVRLAASKMIKRKPQWTDYKRYPLYLRSPNFEYSWTNRYFSHAHNYATVLSYCKHPYTQTKFI